ncbi:hypothetical protein ES332_A01G006800v1 [Gossypium tomentosum]|uniref:TF-B3 domain-containing protein n=1 Tax=Gossypium tomentosum TaxID=34277 RepID=A0A5D2RK89_GOSTO|nr:hypothetical protein ES332_A01G006800v1 [Gossypium tomentosum]
MEIFATVLTITDIERRLSVSNGCLLLQALSHFNGCHGRIVLNVKDDEGTFWNFRCLIRTERYGPKLVIVSGWIDFVRTKDLRQGDIVVLFREEDVIAGMEYKIEVKKKNSFSSLNRIKGSLGLN